MNAPPNLPLPELPPDSPWRKANVGQCMEQLHNSLFLVAKQWNEMHYRTGVVSPDGTQETLLGKPNKVRQPMIQLLKNYLKPLAVFFGTMHLPKLGERVPKHIRTLLFEDGNIPDEPPPDDFRDTIFLGAFRIVYYPLRGMIISFGNALARAVQKQDLTRRYTTAETYLNQLLALFRETFPREYYELYFERSMVLRAFCDSKPVRRRVAEDTQLCDALAAAVEFTPQFIMAFDPIVPGQNWMRLFVDSTRADMVKTVELMCLIFSERSMPFVEASKPLPEGQTRDPYSMRAKLPNLLESLQTMSRDLQILGPTNCTAEEHQRYADLCTYLIYLLKLKDTGDISEDAKEIVNTIAKRMRELGSIPDLCDACGKRGGTWAGLPKFAGCQSARLRGTARESAK